MSEASQEATAGQLADPGGEAPVAGRGVLINLVLSLATQVVGILGQFALVPAFLGAWGEAVYGDWLTLSAISSYLSLTDLGLQLYVINLLTGQSVRGERTEFDRTLQSAMMLYAVLSAIALLVLLGLCVGLPWDSWFASRPVHGQRASVLVLILGVGTLVSVWAGFVAALYRVTGRPELTTALGLLLRVALLGTTLSGLWLGTPPETLAWIHLLVPFLLLVLAGLAFRRHHGRPVFAWTHAERDLARSFLVPSALFAVATVANGLTVQGTLLLTSSVLGPVSATVFATSRTLANAVRQMVSLFNGVAWPEFTRIDAEGGAGRLSTAHRVLVKVSSLLTTWIVSSLWFVGPHLYAAWTGGKVQFDPWLLRLLLLHALLQTPWWCSAVLLTATNRHRMLAYLFLVQGVLAVLLCPLTLRWFGLLGVAISLLVTDFPLFGFLVPSWAQRHVGERPRAYFLDIYLGLALATGGCLAMGWLSSGVLPRTLLGDMLLIAAGMLPVAVAGYAWMRGPERAFLGSLFLRRFPSQER